MVPSWPLSQSIRRIEGIWKLDSMIRPYMTIGAWTVRQIETD